VYAGFTAGNGPGMSIPLENGVYNWPQQFINDSPNSMRAIGGFGCTTSGPRTPGTGESAPLPTDSSSTKTGLSSGGVAGLVVGCVIGANLILLLCIWFFCLSGAAGKDQPHKHLEESKVSGETNVHEIQMESAA
jgi:hypothetical protein